MLRSLNIPARLVTGFSATTRNPLTGYHEIRVLDGHAWVEAWVDDKGWAVLEPTPFYTPPAPPEDRLAAEEIESYVEQLQKFNELSDFDSDLSVELFLTSLWQSISTLFVVIVSYIKLFVVNSWRYLLGTVVIFFAMYMLWKKWKPSIFAIYSYYKVIFYRPGDKKTDVCFYLKHIQRLLDTKGLRRLPGTTIEQYTKQIVNFCNVEFDMELMIALVNNTHYDTVPAGNIDASILKQVFIDLYKPINKQN